MFKLRLLATIAAISTTAFSFTAAAQTTMPLNTGYNHAVFAPYSNPGNPSTIQDNYWIREIASFNGNSSPQAPSWVVSQGGWGPPIPGSHWINFQPTNAAPTGSNPSNPSYAVYKKCFCLMPGYKDASMKFQIRGDDNISIWFNTITNQLLPGVPGNWNGPALNVETDRGFKVGKNCLYVVVEDDHGGQTGFSLAGTVTANGLMPHAAFGTQQSFKPCDCTGQSGALAASPGLLRQQAAEERAIVSQIVRVADQRRRQTIEQSRVRGPIEARPATSN